MTTSALRAKVEYVHTDRCVACACAADSDVTFVEIAMPAKFPVPPGHTIDLAEAERLILCDNCRRMGAQVLGLHRDPDSDPDVQRLAAAREAAIRRLTEADEELVQVQARVAALEAGS